jgi:polysaccharide export outer membrane protein
MKLTPKSKAKATITRLLSGLVIMLSFSSCVQHRQLINFNEANLPEDTPEQIVNAMNLTIQPEDALRIEVSSIDEAAAAPFNLGAQGQQGGMNMQQMGGGGGGFFGLEIFQGYLVDQDGYIDFPVLGPLKVKGLTLEETKALIYGKLEEYLVDPVVNVRYLNLKITVLGEVNTPGLIRLSNKRVTILEAIGMANDLSDYANRNNVLVIREEEGRRTYTRLDLQSAEIFTSPYFYLQQNDVIYVEPIQARIATVADPAQRIISYTTAGLSLISLIIALSR